MLNTFYEVLVELIYDENARNLLRPREPDECHLAECLDREMDSDRAKHPAAHGDIVRLSTLVHHRACGNGDGAA